MELKYTITGRVIDSKTFNGINKALIRLETKPGIIYITQTDDKGIFNLEIKIEVSEQGRVIEKFPLKLVKDNYKSREILPYTLNNKVKTNLGIIRLDPSTFDNKDQISSTITPSESEINTLKKTISKTPEDVLTDLSLNSVDEINKRVIPKLLSLIGAMGIPLTVGEILNPNFLINQVNQSCPDKEKLIKIINQKNKLTSQVNKLYKATNIASKFIGVANGLVSIFKLTKGLALTIPIPTTIGVPPPSGGVIFSLTKGNILKSANNVEKLEKLILKYQNLSLSLLAALLILQITLRKVLNLLKSLDILIQKCVEENNLEIEQVEINKALLNLEIDEEDNFNINELNVNGFNFEIKTKTDDVFRIKRRFAVAKNSQGTVLLKGEPSFSSNDKILVDELIFYIEQENLKAF